MPIIVTISLTGNNSNLSPSHLSGGDEEKDFDIQKNTGRLSIARKLDAARRSIYNLTVRVTDGHHSAITQVRNTSVFFFTNKQMFQRADNSST